MAKSYSTNLNLNANLNASGMTRGAATISKQLTGLRGSLEKTERSFIRMAQRLASVYIIAQTAKTAFKAIAFPISEGFEFNKVLDEQVTALTALTVATSSDIDSLGNRISLTEKYTMAQKESLETMEKLKVINQTTPHNLAETAKIYKTLYAQAKATGSSQEEMVQATQALSLASKAGGIDLTTLLKSIDSLGTGTYLANSEFGKFAEALGVSRTRMKELAKEGDGKALQYFLQQVEQLNVKTDAWAVHTAQLDNVWNNFTGKISKPIFDTAKVSIDSITESLGKLSKDNTLMISLTKGYSSFISSLVNGLSTFAVAIIDIQTNYILPTVESILRFFEKIKIEQASLLATTSSSITWFFSTIGNAISDAWEWVGKKIEEANKQALQHQRILEGNLPSTGPRAAYYTRLKNEELEVVAAQKKVSEGIGLSIDNLKKVKEGITSFKETFNTTLTENIKKQETLLTKIKKAADSGSLGARLQGKDREPEALSAAAIKKLETQMKSFEDAYNSATLSSFDYQREKLLTQASEYEKVIKDKDKINQWYYSELKKINALEVADYEKKETDKRVASANWVFGAEDALAKYKLAADDAYASSSNLFTNAMSGMEDALVDFVTTGKLSFSDLADSIISDIARMVVQQNVTSPIASALGSFNWGSLLASANGNAFVNGKVQAFANGGVVSSPTFFNHSGGAGVAGEAGSEAIMPLVRHGGDLGVKSSPSNVVLNITNNSGNEISAEQVSEMTQTNANGESERVISIVMDGVSRNKNGIRDMLKGVK